jgi:RNA polymerase sigma-32 factor
MNGTEFPASRFEEPMSTDAIDAAWEYTLAKRWHERGDREAERRLMTSQLRLVIQLAWSYRAYGLLFSKLVHEGNRALMDALRHFDPDSGCRFATTARRCIEAALVDYLLVSWPQVQAGSAAEKMRLFFDLCRLKARLAACSKADRLPQSAEVARAATAGMTRRKQSGGSDPSQRDSMIEPSGLVEQRFSFEETAPWQER